MTRREIHTGTDYLLGYVENGVAVLSFNRPESRNALHDDMYFGFGTALPAIALDPTVGCLVITGEGGAFCAGGDVKGMAADGRTSSGDAPREKPTLEWKTEYLRQRQLMVSATIYNFPKTTIAAIPGAVAGAGLSIALSCDMRVGSDSLVMTTAFAKIGASGDFGGSWFLTQLLGAAKAKELYLLSERLNADDTARLGIVNRVFPQATFDADWRAFAERVASGPTLAHRYIKENINRAASGASLQACLDAEAIAMMKTMESSDHREAAMAFVQKRPPTFEGR